MLWQALRHVVTHHGMFLVCTCRSAGCKTVRRSAQHAPVRKSASRSNAMLPMQHLRKQRTWCARRQLDRGARGRNATLIGWQNGNLYHDQGPKQKFKIKENNLEICSQNNLFSEQKGQRARTRGSS